MQCRASRIIIYKDNANKKSDFFPFYADCTDVNQIFPRLMQELLSSDSQGPEI